MNETHPCILSVINQSDEQTALKFYSLEEIQAENENEELIRRIDRMQRTLLTSELTFPLEKERSVQLHPHVEPNETDTKIDDELRRNDVKELVPYRKFAKVALRCFVKLKHAEAKKILVSLLI